MGTPGDSRGNGEPDRRRVRVFISYKHTDPDQRIATEVYEALCQQHDVFIDQTLLVGMRWAERIEAELQQTDFLVSFLSAESVASEMVLAEIETAHHLHRRYGRPVILPVRLAFHDSLQYPLSAYINPISWAVWNSDEDTPQLIQELLAAISSGTFSPTQSSQGPVSVEQLLPAPLASAQPVSLEMPEGTIAPQSQFYIERDADHIGFAALARQGVTITIKGPRQMGKSSLLMRLIDRANQNDRQVAFLDFQLLDHETLTDAELFFYQFCVWLTDELCIEDRVDEYWNLRLGCPQRCSRYMERYLLQSLGRPLVMAMDEVENIFDTSFRSDFFAMLRHWHNSRARSRIWQQLDLFLVTSTEPYQFIENLNQSPFNVGEVLELEDFTSEQVDDLNRRHGTPLSTTEVQALMNLAGGHPFLIRKALYLVASGRMPAGELLRRAGEQHGPFGDHLRYHLFRLHGHNDLIEGFRQVLLHHRCPDDRTFFRLRGAGLIRRRENDVVPRCPLYGQFFGEHLYD